jgi:hypothetical protein
VSTDLQRKKSEAATAWQEYMTAVEKAENNRQMITGARAAIFQALTSRNAFQIAPAYLAMPSTEQQQSGLDAEETRLGKRFDEISDELASLQQEVSK